MSTLERAIAIAREAHPLAAQVKRADLRHNMDLSRIPAPGPEDHERVVRYRRALALLDQGT